VGDINFAAIHKHGHPTVRGEGCAHLCLAAAIRLAHTPASVTSAIIIGPCVPSRLREAIAVVLDNVHFHATWLVLTLDIAVIAGLKIAWGWRDEIEVVVHACMCSGCVHVELNIATKQIEGLFAMNTATSCHGPASSVPLQVISIHLEVIL